MAQLIRVPAYRAGDPGLNPGAGDSFSLKLTTEDLPDGYSENKIFIICPLLIFWLFTVWKLFVTYCSLQLKYLQELLNNLQQMGRL